MLKFPCYRGFNLLAKFAGWGPGRKFKEDDFEIMAEWDFDFARIPMSYWSWASKDDWYRINEDVLKDIDEVVEFGKQYKVHINLNFHRVPGYCINGRDMESVDLFDDTPENMQKALDAVVYHWKPLMDMGVPVHVGEWGCYNKTPHDVVLRWMRDLLSLWKEVGWGYAMWNLKGDFGVLDSKREDVKYENYKSHKLDRKMLELLKEFKKYFPGWTNHHQTANYAN